MSVAESWGDAHDRAADESPGQRLAEGATPGVGSAEIRERPEPNQKATATYCPAHAASRNFRMQAKTRPLTAKTAPKSAVLYPSDPSNSTQLVQLRTYVQGLGDKAAPSPAHRAAPANVIAATFRHRMRKGGRGDEIFGMDSDLGSRAGLSSGC